MIKPLKLTILGTLISIGIISCNQTLPALLNCEINNILLDESFFAPGAVISPNLSPLPEGTKNSVGNTVYLGRGILVQNILPFSSTRRAKSEFNEDLRDPAFHVGSTWSPPPNMRALDIAADDFRLACGLQHDIPMCRALLQNDNFYVFINAHTYENEFSPSDFAVAIQEIDQRIQYCIAGDD